jgi:hypothetical protein
MDINQTKEKGPGRVLWPQETQFETPLGAMASAW